MYRNENINSSLLGSDPYHAISIHIIDIQYLMLINICAVGRNETTAYRTFNSLGSSYAYMCQWVKPPLFQIMACGLFDASMC